MTTELLMRNPELLGENGVLFKKIDFYIEDFICKEFLSRGEYPNWKEELVGEDSDEFIDNIIQQTINSEDYEDYNQMYFHIPSPFRKASGELVRNTHGLILQYISLYNKEEFDPDYIVDEKFIFDGDRACSAYACYWLMENKEWLKNKLNDYRLSCMEEDEEEEVSN